MRWKDLARSAGIAGGSANPEITGVTHHSGWVQPGDVFVAIRGATTDGRRFIGDACANGARLIVGQSPPPRHDNDIPYVVHPRPRVALAALATAINGRPAERMRVVGITGTDGKTTTTLLVRHLLRSADVGTAMLSTIGYELPDGELRQAPAHFTTPEAPQVQAILREAADAGAEAMVLETSSHALAQERVGGIAYEIGVWTHLSREHLDFHKSMQAYFAAKRLLIERSQHAILNADDEWCDLLKGISPRQTTYSPSGHDGADWRALEAAESAAGLTFIAVGPAGERIDARLPLVGRFNVENALAAIAAASAYGLTPDQIEAALPTFGGVAGRMEFVGSDPAHPRVVVDFAHTPAAIRKAIEALRPTTPGKLWIVLGVAGGQRDPGRRIPMGESAAAADVVVITEDDSYDTPLDVLMADLRAGAERAGARDVRSISNRRSAIRHVISDAEPGDTVLLAGKGPETELGRPNGPVDWSDVDEARAALAGRGTR